MQVAPDHPSVDAIDNAFFSSAEREAHHHGPAHFMPLLGGTALKIRRSPSLGPSRPTDDCSRIDLDHFVL
jgi:hypothetical protein